MYGKKLIMALGHSVDMKVTIYHIVACCAFMS